MKRALFLFLIVVLGFAVERVFHLALDSSSETSRVSEFRIVIIGGSIARGLAPHLEARLRREMQRNDITVIDAAVRMADLRLAKIIAADALERHRPKMILFMLGFEEKAADPTDASVRLANAIVASDAPGAATIVEETFEKVGPLRATVLLFEHHEAFSKEPFRPAIENMLRRQLARRMERNPQSNPIAIRQALTLSSLLVMLNRARPVNERDLAEQVARSVDDVVSTTRSWPSEVESKTYRAFIATSPDPLRSWFWLAWKNRKLKENQDVVAFYASEPENIRSIIPMTRFVSSNEIVAKKLEGREPAEIYRALRISERNLPPVPEMTSASNLDEWKELFSIVREHRARPILLQYPNVRLQLIDEIGKSNDVPVLGDEKLFDTPIRGNGRGLYFLDDVHGSGHLSAPGREIYVKFLAEKLSPEIEKAN